MDREDRNLASWVWPIALATMGFAVIFEKDVLGHTSGVVATIGAIVDRLNRQAKSRELSAWRNETEAMLEQLSLGASETESAESSPVLAPREQVSVRGLLEAIVHAHGEASSASESVGSSILDSEIAWITAHLEERIGQEIEAHLAGPERQLVHELTTNPGAIPAALADEGPNDLGDFLRQLMDELRSSSAQAADAHVEQ